MQPVSMCVCVCVKEGRYIGYGAFIELGVSVVLHLSGVTVLFKGDPFQNSTTQINDLCYTK